MNKQYIGYGLYFIFAKNTSERRISVPPRKNNFKAAAMSDEKVRTPSF